MLIMLNVLEQIEDDVRALKNLFKLLKPGGILVAKVPAGSRLYDSYDEDLCHFRRHSASELKRKLNEIGFIVYMTSHLGFVLCPAFALFKLLNKRLSFKRKKIPVRDHALITSCSMLVNWVMKIELTYLSTFHSSFGIRTRAVAIRPK